MVGFSLGSEPIHQPSQKRWIFCRVFFLFIRRGSRRRNFFVFQALWETGGKMCGFIKKWGNNISKIGSHIYPQIYFYGYNLFHPCNGGRNKNHASFIIVIPWSYCWDSIQNNATIIQSPWIIPRIPRIIFPNFFNFGW